MARGTLRIYLGAAPGVGKTYAMLSEGWRRAERGSDVVVGYVETHGRIQTAQQLRDLEVVPRMQVSHPDQLPTSLRTIRSMMRRQRWGCRGVTRR